MQVDFTLWPKKSHPTSGQKRDWKPEMQFYIWVSIAETLFLFVVRILNNNFLSDIDPISPRGDLLRLL